MIDRTRFIFESFLILSNINFSVLMTLSAGWEFDMLFFKLLVFNRFSIIRVAILCITIFRDMNLKVFWDVCRTSACWDFLKIAFTVTMSFLFMIDFVFKTLNLVDFLIVSVFVCCAIFVSVKLWSDVIEIERVERVQNFKITTFCWYNFLMIDFLILQYLKKA